jgi:hypothetical protein
MVAPETKNPRTAGTVGGIKKHTNNTPQYRRRPRRRQDPRPGYADAYRAFMRAAK